MWNILALAALGTTALVMGCCAAPESVPSPSAQQATTGPSEAERLPVATYQCKHAVDEIKVDGLLDEQSWKQAEVVPIRCERTNSKQCDPPAGFGRMCWDDKNFYIAIEVPDTDIRSEGTERDKGNIAGLNDLIEVFLDINGDDQNLYELHVTALNTFNDLWIIRPPEGTPLAQRTRWGIIFMVGFNLEAYQTAVKVYGTLNNPADKDEKWVVEMALPYSSLMMPLGPDKETPKPHPDPGEVWRVQLVVQNPTLGERYYVWSPAYSAWHHHGIKRYGRVTFVAPAAPK